MDEITMIRLSNAEHATWQDVTKEFRKVVGDIDDPKYNALVAMINRWGEYLVAFRVTQDDRSRLSAFKDKSRIAEKYL